MRKVFIGLLLCFCANASFGQWDSLTSGVEIPSAFTVVNALAAYEDTLFVGGVFSMAGGMNELGLSEWNGTNWIIKSGVNGQANSMTIYKGNLYVGGSFSNAEGVTANNIVMYNGTTWTDLGKGVNGFVNALAVYNGNLYVGGQFDSAGGIPAKDIAIWNGASWSSIGRINGKSPYSDVSSFCVFNGDLCVGGYFDTVGSIITHNIAKWNGASWSAMGTGINDSSVLSLATYNKKLYAGGYNDPTGLHGNFNAELYTWNGSAWNNVAYCNAQNSSAFEEYLIGALFVYDSVLCIGGTFDSIGGISANNIAYWDGNNWGTFASGVNGWDVLVNSFGIYDSTLYVGGQFDTAGGIPANNVASWKGQPTSVNEIKSQSISVSVFPNPSHGTFQLRIRNDELGIKKTVEVYNVLGEKVYSSPYSIHNGEYFFDISNNPPGLYIYRIISSNGTYMASGKFVLE